MTCRFVRWLLASLAVLLLLVTSTSARATEPVIEKGREADVVSLFAPFTLGSEISGGWKLWNIGVEQTSIEVGIRNAAEQDASFVLVHPTRASTTAMRTPSFAVDRDVPDEPGARAAREALVQSIRNNDDGKFWRVRRQLNARAGTKQPVLRARALLEDGFVLSVAGLLLSIVLAIHVTRTAPRVVRIGVPLVVLAGVALRVVLSPASFLGAWPWSRLWPNWHTIWTSSAFGTLAAYLDKEVYLTDLMLSVNLVYACLMPLVLFVHASQLLRDTRAGLIAAALVAFSPHHIRYSHSEDAFVPSLVLTSLAFALIHTFLRDPARLWRWIALGALPFVLWQGYLLRPLNILFVGVYLGAIVLLHPEQSTLRRRVVVGIVTLGVWLAAFGKFLEMYSGQVTDAATDPRWLLKVPFALLWPPWNLLIHPLATPPAALVLAALGVLWLVRKGEKRLAVFLVGWLAAFFVAHAYVVSAPMQPRYHLHLLVPFVLLASVAAVEAHRRHRRLFVVAAVSVFLAPLIGKGWIRDTGYSDTLEYEFVRNARTLVSKDCTVIEYVGPRPEDAHESRFARIAQTLYRMQYGERFSTVLARLEPSETGEPVLNEEARAALQAGPEACVYVYEGLPCWGRKEKHEEYAPACSAMVHAAPLETVLEARIPFRPYDENVTAGMHEGRSQLRLALSRVVPRSNVAEARP